MRHRYTGYILLTALMLGVAGCAPKQPPTRADLRATNTPARVPALVNAADQDDERSLGELVHALSDDDPAVRLFAIQALNRRTGQTLGYRYYESADRRRVATRRWEDWLDQRSNPAPGSAPDAAAEALP